LGEKKVYKKGYKSLQEKILSLKKSSLNGSIFGAAVPDVNAFNEILG
jgi:hypothetical protein